jgi:hypothetical protein
VEIVVSVACVIAVLMLWWAVAAWISWQSRRAGQRRSVAPWHPSACTAPAHPEAAIVVDADPAIGWADPAQVRPALEAENVLLADRLADRISVAEFQARMTDLAWHCEPNTATGFE